MIQVSSLRNCCSESSAAHPLPEFGDLLCSSKARVIQELSMMNCCRMGFISLTPSCGLWLVRTGEVPLECSVSHCLPLRCATISCCRNQGMPPEQPSGERHCQLCAHITARAQSLTLHLLSLYFDNLEAEQEKVVEEVWLYCCRAEH